MKMGLPYPNPENLGPIYKIGLLKAIRRSVNWFRRLFVWGKGRLLNETPGLLNRFLNRFLGVFAGGLGG